MRDYEWSLKSTFEKTRVYIFGWLCFAAWMYFVVAIGAHHIPNFSEFCHAIWGMLKGLALVAIFPIGFLSIAFFFRKEIRLAQQHRFYREWATVLTGYGKRGGAFSFFFEEVASLRIREAVYKNEPFYVVKIRFKPSLNSLGKEREVSIGLRSEKEKLKLLSDWALGHQVMFTWEPPEEVMRRLPS